MSTYEAAYKTLLQGVSQQRPDYRLPGQNTAQVNMVSDPVTGIRRRPGLEVQNAFGWPDATDSNVLAWFTDIAGQRVHILLNTSTGILRILNEDYVLQATLDSAGYLTTANVRDIRAAAVGSEFFLANCDVLPTVEVVGTTQNPGKGGFFYVLAGAFGKEYNVSMIVNGGAPYTVSYTTPSGAAPGDAALATPEYIATQLATALTGVFATVAVYRDGPYVFLQASVVSPVTSLAIGTSTGSVYLISSKSGVVTAAGNLPARLPAQADGYPCRVGSGTSPQYYVYDHTALEWVEGAAYLSPSAISDAPISVYWDEIGMAWALNLGPFEGRLSGDDISNPRHEFMKAGITGMGTYQGRLVLLSGSLVSLSASGNPRRFFRSTVTSLLNNDPIEIGSSQNSSAAYEWAVPYQKDLVLFSRMYQAVLPSGNQAVTPSTATVVPTSSHEVDTLSGPITIGRTLMYSHPNSADFFGVMEMLPSGTTDSQYVSQDSTPHLPKYFGGRCRFAVASSVANLALFAPTGDMYSLMVHEYQWDGDVKAQQAWHQWTFEYPVAAAYFVGDQVTVVFIKNEQAVLCTVDPLAGAFNNAGEIRPFLDMNFTTEIVDNVITLPAWVGTFDPLLVDKLKAVSSSGGLAGELVGTSVGVGDTTLVTVLSWPSGPVAVGVPYYSSLIPSPPTVTDYNKEVIHTGKATLLRYLVNVANSAEFQVKVDDRYTEEDPLAEATLTFSSPELELGRGLYADEAVCIIPCRTDLRSTSMELFTEGTGELNITSLEYVAKFNPKIRRK